MSKSTLTRRALVASTAALPAAAALGLPAAAQAAAEPDPIFAAMEQTDLAREQSVRWLGVLTKKLFRKRGRNCHQRPANIPGHRKWWQSSTPHSGA